MTLQEVVAAIRPAAPAARKQAEIQWSNVGKPLGSLGLLEDMVVRMAGMFGTADFSIANKAVVPFCADNGVVAEGVTQSSQEVTAVVAGNMARRTSSVCRMAKVAGAQVYPVDIGMAFAVDAPLILIPVGIIYIAETMSDIIQVTYFKLTHGKRIFRMAPLHHHLELGGWSEVRIVLTFTAITVAFCLLAFAGVMYRYGV